MLYISDLKLQHQTGTSKPSQDVLPPFFFHIIVPSLAILSLVNSCQSAVTLKQMDEWIIALRDTLCMQSKLRSLRQEVLINYCILTAGYIEMWPLFCTRSVISTFSAHIKVPGRKSSESLSKNEHVDLRHFYNINCPFSFQMSRSCQPPFHFHLSDKSDETFPKPLKDLGQNDTVKEEQN